jgi:diacylglycerol O-acyltransferase
MWSLCPASLSAGLRGGVEVPERLSSLDVSFLYLEQPTTVMHVGSVMILRPRRGGFDMGRFTRFVGSRIPARYRQRARSVPGRIAKPVWVDDPHFDLSYHIRQSALPRPGSDEQLAELVARLQARPLDRRRPLWEIYVVEGLTGGRIALVSKTHQALVDGVETVDLGQLILDTTSRAPEPPPFDFHPEPGPTTVELVAGAVIDSVLRPGQVVETIRDGVGDVRHTAAEVVRSAGRVIGTARRLAGSPAHSPLLHTVSSHRRFAMVSNDLADYRTIRTLATSPGAGRGSRRVNAGSRLDITVNDVVLAVLAGALRSWLMTRGEPVPSGSGVRTLVPMSVLPTEPEDPAPLGSRVTSLLIDLPTGEASPMVRLHQVAYQTKAYRETGRAIDAKALAGIAGFAPPTLHSLGARVASGLSHRMFHLVVSNVPGPQHALYADGARLLATYPVVPLAPGQALSIGLTSYDGSVHYGLNADREAMPDVDVVGHCITDALTELLEAVR